MELEDIPEVSTLIPEVIRILGLNPGKFTLQGTNTYLVGSGPKRFLIDTGEGISDYLDNLSIVLQMQNCTIDRIFITHWHHDHVGGISDVLKLLRNKQPVTLCKFGNKEHDEALQQNYNCKFEVLQDGDVFKTEGATLKVIHTPGHTEDHMSLYYVEKQILFSGDSVLGHGSAVFENLKSYMDSLQKVLDGYTIGPIYPSHGHVVEDGKAKIQEYIDHRNLREQQIVELLERFQSERPVTAMDLVEKIYEGYPKDLYPAAEGSVLLHLRKLLEENKVIKESREENNNNGPVTYWILKTAASTKILRKQKRNFQN